MSNSSQSINTVVSTINFNSYSYTIKLIDSLLKANLSSCRVVICDNSSNDDSCANIDNHLQKIDWLSKKKLDIDSHQIATAQLFLANNDVEFIFLQLCDNRLVLIRY